MPIAIHMYLLEKKVPFQQNYEVQCYYINISQAWGLIKHIRYIHYERVTWVNKSIGSFPSNNHGFSLG